MLYLFFGEDEFTSLEEARGFAGQLAQKSKLETSVVDASEEAKQVIFSNIETVSMFGSGEQIHLIKRPFSNKDIVPALIDSNDRLKSKQIVLWQPGKIDKRKSDFKQLTKVAQTKEFPQLNQKEMVNWLAKELRSLKIKDSTRLSAELVERLGANKGILTQEVIKISNYLDAGGAADKILEFVTDNSSGDIWKLLDALGNGDKSTALDELDKFMQQDRNDQYLIAMLTRELAQMADLLICKAQQLDPKSLKLHPFVLQKLEKKVTRTSLSKVQKLTQALLRLDIGIKEGQVDPHTGLSLLFYSW